MFQLNLSLSTRNIPSGCRDGQDLIKFANLKEKLGHLCVFVATVCTPLPCTGVFL